jgi:hypothetical protein
MLLRISEFHENQLNAGHIRTSVTGVNEITFRRIANTVCMYVVRSKSFLPDQLFKVTEIKQLFYFST